MKPRRLVKSKGPSPDEHLVGMAGGESSRTARRAPAERADQSRSAAVEIAAVLVLLEEGKERVEEGHAAVVEHATRSPGPPAAGSTAGL
jgi:hypothetical protein